MMVDCLLTHSPAPALTHSLTYTGHWVRYAHSLALHAALAQSPAHPLALAALTHTAQCTMCSLTHKHWWWRLLNHTCHCICSLALVTALMLTSHCARLLAYTGCYARSLAFFSALTHSLALVAVLAHSLA